jgi:ribosome-associated protein
MAPVPARNAPHREALLSQRRDAFSVEADPDSDDAEVSAAGDSESATPSDDALASNTIAHAPEEVQAMIALILKRLDDDQAQDVVVIDLKDKSPLADAIVVVSGRSQRHVASMADHLLRSLKEGGFGKAQVEGLPQADWVLIDASDVIVHLFRPEVRAFYNLEKIWSVEPPRRLGGVGHIPSLQAT